jgi:hypothetical protein
VHWVVFPLDKQLRLSREQHRRFVATIVEKTRPLQRYGELEDEAILLQASELPEDTLKPIFTEAQWLMLRERFHQAKRQERILIEQGYIPEKQSAVTPPAVPDPGARRGATGSRIGPLRRGRTGLD